jgi:hypothetical protein
MKTEHSGKLEKIEAKLSTSNHDQVNIGDLLNKGLDKPFKAGLCV